MKVLYDTVLKGTFVRRPNRFVVHIELDGQEGAAPNAVFKYWCKR